MQVIIDGVGLYDGKYPLSFDSLSQREQHRIRLLCGLRPTEYGDALTHVDSGFMVAIAIVALAREGKPINEDLVWDAPFGSVRFDFSDEVADASPPDESPAESNSTDGGESESSGTASAEPSESPGTIPEVTGVTGSATGATSAPQTSAT